MAVSRVLPAKATGTISISSSSVFSLSTNYSTSWVRLEALFVFSIADVITAQLSDEPHAAFNLMPSRSTQRQDSPFPVDGISDDIDEDPYDIVPLLDLVSAMT